MTFNYGALSDEDLYLLLKKGDTIAYTVIFNKYFDVLYIHALSKIKEEDEAKDLVQEIFVNLWNNKEKLNVTSNLKSYLYVSIRNKILDYIAHLQVANKYTDSLQSFINEGHCFTDHLVRERQLTKIIEEHIAQLPEKMQTIFQMSRKDTLSHKEIALKLGLSELTVKKQVANAVKILRNKLGANFFLIF